MTREEAKHKLDFMKKAYQKLIDEKVDSGKLVGDGVRGEWKAETPLDEAYKSMIDALETAIKALEQQPCDDCIRRSDMLDAVGHGTTYTSEEVQDIIDGMPSVTPQQKMGKWLYNKEEDSYKCSLCGFPCHKDNLGAIPTNYCAGCGAKMSEIPTGAEGSE